MNIIDSKMDGPMDLSEQTPNSTASSTIYASPVSHSYPPPYYPDDASNGAEPASGTLRRSARRYDSHDRDYSHVPYYGDRYSPDDVKPMRRQGHARSESNGNNSVVSSGLGRRSGDGDSGSSNASPTTEGHSQRKKQKRNKPTLSCFECVERKTKVP